MKKFILQTCLFTVIILISILSIFFHADGYADPFYLRFTTPRQTSLILGPSRAAQGIHPQVLNALFERNDLFNYSFTIGTSPYGPVFLNSIKQKLDTTVKNGLFILAVDPWGISASVADPENMALFEENKLLLSTTKNVNRYPNFSYLFTNFDSPYYKILFNKIQINYLKQMLLHPDGWLEVLTDFGEQEMESNTLKRVKEYESLYSPFYTFSQTRYEYLAETIDFLNLRGKVYLVRLPVHEGILRLDNLLIPDFSEKMTRLALQKQIPYFDFTDLSNDFTFIDGIHLSKKSGREVSEMIAKKIVSDKE
jgi:hypothetical protein